MLLNLLRVVALVCLGLPTQLWAQNSVSEDPLLDGYGAAREEIQRIWNRRRDLKNFGEDRLGQKYIDQMQMAKAKAGLSDLSDISLALMREAQEAANNSQMDLARSLLQQAILVSPNLLETHVRSLTWHIKGKIFSIPGFAKEVSEIFLRIARDPILYLPILFNLTLFVAIASAVLLLVIFLLAFLRFVPNAVHTLEHFPIIGGIASAPLVVFTIASLTAFIFFGVYGLFVLMGLVPLLFLDKVEQVFILVLLAIIGSLPSGFQLIDQKAALATSIYRDCLSVSRGTDIAAAAKRIKNYLEINPKDPIALFAMATAERAAGRGNEAKLLYQQATKIAPDFAKAHVNLANLLYESNRSTEALEGYQQAVNRDPRLFWAHYNIWRVQIGETNLDRSNQSLKFAKSIDADLFEQLELQTRRFPSDQLVLFSAPLEWFDIFRYAKPSTRTELPKSITAWLICIWSLFAIHLVSLFVKPVSSRLAQSCEKCGTITCSRCDIWMGDSSICPQCYNVYVKRITIDPEIKIRKERSVRAYQKRRRGLAIFTNFILPGSGHFLLGSGRVGILSTGITCILWCLILPLPLFEPFAIYGFLNGGGFLVATFALFVHYIVTTIQVVKN